MRELPVIAAAAALIASAPLASLAQETSEATDTPQVEEMTLGNPDADVTVIEYASFTCPHCKTFHDTVLPELKENYIDTGRIEFVYREVYFDRFGLWAGMVARCGGPERYFGISDLIYEQQQEWVQGDPAQIAENLRRIGKTAGLDDAELDACLSDTAQAEAMVARFEETTQADDITATPSFVIDGETFSNMPYSEFASILDEKLAD
ncbi:protein-disulfide isomerase [Palleronia aestuarii]|uniref:Protein-disulfide isomerase n=1 Tax=Palleronia aestuarii TaxID=568105 RepID=A0A2W7NA65_9RHOB|nr:DsbA family protein [Palleronia aestuarii]PZX16533.1 protein-disulfide isomerase [Palleronia aestuarii]